MASKWGGKKKNSKNYFNPSLSYTSSNLRNLDVEKKKKKKNDNLKLVHPSHGN